MRFVDVLFLPLVLSLLKLLGLSLGVVMREAVPDPSPSLESASLKSLLAHRLRGTPSRDVEALRSVPGVGPPWLSVQRGVPPRGVAFGVASPASLPCRLDRRL